MSKFEVKKDLGQALTKIRNFTEKIIHLDESFFEIFKQKNFAKRLKR